MRWTPETDRKSCMSYYGNMQQLAGLRRSVLSDGKAAGVEAVDVDTGAGLHFTVLPGRGMDIAWASYDGIPVSYLSKAGVTAPGYHDKRDMQWLQSFFAGMITTCGMTNAGPPVREELPIVGDTPFGLHGDVSNTGADNVCTREEWMPDGGYRLYLSGRMQEGRLHGEHMQLRREITAYLGSKKFTVHDVYSNEGDTPQPLTFFYHINIGHPILGPEARFVAPTVKLVPASPEAAKYVDSYDLFDEPTPGYMERQYYHTLATDQNGQSLAALINEKLGLGICLRFSPSELPCLSQWKVCRPGEYVLAFEPGNCYPWGRTALREKGKLEILEPMQEHPVTYSLEILDGADEIESIRKEIEKLTGDAEK